jgi:hypothetical protein
MIRRLMLAGVGVLGLAAPAVAQQPDMAAMQKWLTAKHVAWHIVGKYDGETSVTSDGQGMGRITDVIEIDVVVDWQNNNTIVGTPAIKNTPSTVAGLRDREPKCLAPSLNGPFDYVTLDSVTPGMIGGLHFKMTTSYPAATVSQVCTSTKVAPAKKETDEDEFPLPQPTLLAMGMATANLAVSPDKKSLIVKNVSEFRGWTWTLTPTPR